MNKPVALITGAGRGIGYGIASLLAENNYDLVIDDVHEEIAVKDAMDALKAKGADVLYVRADISKAEQRQVLINQTREKFGRLDLLVNNAGVGPKERLDILDATEESYDRVMTINLKSPYFLTQLIAKWMIEQKNADNTLTPKIVNISSMSSFTSSTSRGEYCLSKTGISMMTKLYADRLAEYNIPVYEIQPGIIYTDMTSVVKEKYDKLIAEGLTPIKRWGYPEDIAKAVLAMALNYFPFSTGEVIHVDGGFHIQRL
ncbi:3-ketoacyl-ACP reductase [bacterium]|nr:3-ketoacyl-ACP reductase [bacterium]